MHSLYKRKEPIPSLYVKTAYGPSAIRAIFTMARNMAPCMLIMEDMETVVYGGSRSYFFNEVDGLENNDGILMIGTTNYIARLDPGITKRPSRFDRKYLFPIPSNDERVQYCEFWHKKILKNPAVNYPKKLVNLIAAITFGFSFAYMQEAFVATLLELARSQGIDMAAFEMIGSDAATDESSSGCEYDVGDDNNDGDDDDDDDLDKIPFWRVMRQQVSILREDLSRNVTSVADTADVESVLATPRRYLESLFGLLSWGGTNDAQRTQVVETDSRAVEEAALPDLTSASLTGAKLTHQQRLAMPNRQPGSDFGFPQ